MRNTTPIRRATYKRRRRINPYIIRRCVIAAIVLAALAPIAALFALGVTSAKDAQRAASYIPEEMVNQHAKTSGIDANEATETSQEPAVFFKLTDEERTLIEQVVSAESRGEPYDGQVAVAQCILNACLKDGIRPAEAIVEYKYTKNRVEPTSSVRAAVAAVFDRGEGVTDEPIVYFYNPAIGCGDFHETQIFVIEIKNHRFFKEAE